MLPCFAYKRDVARYGLCVYFKSCISLRIPHSQVETQGRIKLSEVGNQASAHVKCSYVIVQYL